MRILVGASLLFFALLSGGAVHAPAATCGGERATIVGTARGDRLVGTRGADVIQARGGNDVIWGLSGFDVICGGEGADESLLVVGATA